MSTIVLPTTTTYLQYQEIQLDLVFSGSECSVVVGRSIQVCGGVVGMDLIWVTVISGG